MTGMKFLNKEWALSLDSGLLMGGINERTVSKYRELAEKHGLLKGELPDMRAVDDLLKEKSLIVSETKPESGFPVPSRILSLIFRVPGLEYN